MKSHFAIGRRVLCVAASALALSLSACASKTQEKTAQERQDEAMKDPFRYKPDFKDNSVTSGGPTDLDKDGLKKDLGHVLMP